MTIVTKLPPGREKEEDSDENNRTIGIEGIEPSEAETEAEVGTGTEIGTYRLIPVFRGFRAESTQSLKPYFTHRSQGLSE